MVFKRLRGAGLLLNRSKCIFQQPVVDFLGHRVTAAGIAPLQSRVAAVRDFPEPKNNRQLMSFLGMLNFYRRFLPRAAKLLKPLTDSLKGGMAQPVQWTDEKKAAFVAAKQLLTDATCLAHPRADAEIQLAVDASNTHIGAVLQQASERGFQPLAFFSKKLDAAQMRYSTFDRELLACHEAVRHFKWFLEGREFHIATDHKPLTYALVKAADAWSGRQQRQLSTLAEFTTDIRHVKGEQNVVADALSRPAAAVQVAPVVAVVKPTAGEIDYQQLAADQKDCEQVQQLLKSSSLKVMNVLFNGSNVLCDVSAATPRPIVPVVWRKRAFDLVHGLAHPGIRATKRLLTSRFVWPKCATDAAEWCRQCLGCGRGKPGGEQKIPVEAIRIPEERFSHVHVDLVGPLSPSAGGHTHLMTVIDRTTRWPEVFPLTDITARSCADMFIEGWVARYGTPAIVTTDRGAQFTSEVWQIMCKTLGVTHITTSAYHPCSNGLVERLHRQIKEALRSRECGTAWAEHLPWVLLGIRAAPKEEAGVSAAEAVFGRPLNLPGQAVRAVGAEDRPLIPTTVREAEPEPEQKQELQPGQYVFVRRPASKSLQPVFDGPYRVIQVKKKVVCLQFGPGAAWISRSRIKRYEGSAEPKVVVRRGRGRPRKKKNNI
jgi:hypothetical protein